MERERERGADGDDAQGSFEKKTGIAILSTGSLAGLTQTREQTLFNRAVP